VNISVIIRTLNEEDWIGHTIQSVLDFFSKPEIIIVDNYSTDQTLNIVKHFKKDPNLNDIDNPQYTSIKTLNIKDYTPGKSLNLGIKNSTNDYILIISSHCVLKNININKIYTNLENYVCIFGNQIPVWKGKRIEKRYVWSHFKDKEVINMYSEMEKRYFMHNALAFYKKNTLIDYPFDTNLVGKEDRYWVNDMIKEGKKTFYDPEFSAYHHYTINGNTWKGMG
tara:strand:+ start:632 stop:1303 length:672 start_codon:yes stop_codon:yes gene_type:complete